MDTFEHLAKVKCLKMSIFVSVLTRDRVRKMNTLERYIVLQLDILLQTVKPHALTEK